MKIFAATILSLTFRLINAISRTDESNCEKTDAADEEIKYVNINGTRLDFVYWNSDLGNDKPVQIEFGNESRVLDYWIKSLPLKVITHGWLASDNNSTGVFVIKTAYVDTGGFNVISVDWSTIADSIIYTVSVRATEPVGSKIAEFLDRLVKVTGLHPSDIHLIGHSLGAHVAGSCGHHLKSGKVGRITALDPAAPGFQIFSFFSKPLSKDDAVFVDVIHTAGGSLGYSESIGHVDFYPNSGTASQPGCGTLFKMFDFISCSHSRAHELYVETVYNKTIWTAVECSTWFRFKDDKCENNTRVHMGHGATPSAKGDFFLFTNKTSPFGLY